MLVLTRMDGEALYIGDSIRITLLRGSSGRARIGIEAPDSVKVLRCELVSGAVGELERKWRDAEARDEKGG